MEKNKTKKNNFKKSFFFLANWKNGMTRKKVLKFCQDWKNYSLHKKINLGIAGAFVHLELLKKQKLNGVQIWAQDCANKNNLQQTGKIIPLLLKDYCYGVVIGHVESGDNNATIYQKLQLVNQANLKIVLCCGPNLNQKNLTTQAIMQIVKKQLQERIKNLNLVTDNLVAIAYEQHTSKENNNKQARKEILKVVNFISKTVYQLWKKEIKIFYGGEVNKKNVQKYYQTMPIEGFLIGRQSLTSQKLIKLIELIKN